MRKYETPELTVENIAAQDVIAANFVEGGGDNEAPWIEGWASGVNDLRG